MSKTTILVNPRTREDLKRLGTKNQTYDEIIVHLIKVASDSKEKRNTLVDRLETLQSSEFTDLRGDSP